MPPVKIKLPVPLGLIEISILVSVPIDDIFPLLPIWICLSAAPTVNVSFAASTLKYGTDSVRSVSYTHLRAHET